MLTRPEIIWFLAPAVSLCGQQFNKISLQVTWAKIRLLTSNENVYTWNTAEWSQALEDVRVVVSTYQVLLDALSNAFISMHNLTLIIFDEGESKKLPVALSSLIHLQSNTSAAHNCVEKHPGSKVMANFYHGRRHRSGDMPSILGLTATPSMRSSVPDMETLEAILDARCVSPTLHRETLVKFFKKPEIKSVGYLPPGPSPAPTKAMRALRDTYCNMNIMQDPYILSLQAEPNERNCRLLSRAIQKDDT